MDIGEVIKKTFIEDKISYNEGKCVEMAIAIKENLPEAGLQVGHRYWTNEGIEYENPLSHVVVLYKNQTYDSDGAKALERWEDLYEFPYDCGGDEDVYFDWSDISIVELEQLVKKHRLNNNKIDNSLIEKLSKKIKESLKNNKILQNTKKIGML